MRASRVAAGVSATAVVVGAAAYARRSRRAKGSVERVVTVARPAADVELLWRDPDARSQFAVDGLEPGEPQLAAAPGGRGTEVRLRCDRASERAVRETLRRFKRLAEAGEIPTTEGQPSGKRSPLGRVLVGRRERGAE